MYAYRHLHRWTEALLKSYKSTTKGVGNGELSICLDERSPFFGTSPLGQGSLFDLGSEMIKTGEVKEPDSGKAINSGRDGRAFIFRIQSKLVPYLQYVQDVVALGAKLGLPLGETTFEKCHLEMSDWGGAGYPLSFKFELGEMTENEICYIFQITRELAHWKKTNAGVAASIFTEPVHEFLQDPKLLLSFWNDSVDPTRVFKSEVMIFVSMVGWVMIKREDYRRCIHFKRISGGHLKFVVKNIPLGLFKKPKEVPESHDSDSYGHGVLERDGSPGGGPIPPVEPHADSVPDGKAGSSEPGHGATEQDGRVGSSSGVHAGA